MPAIGAYVTDEVVEKASRLLTEGRLVVDRVDASGLIVATCRGDSGTYKLGRDPRRSGEWRCGCKARGLCSHLLSLQLVTGFAAVEDEAS